MKQKGKEVKAYLLIKLAFFIILYLNADSGSIEVGSSLLCMLLLSLYLLAFYRVHFLNNKEGADLSSKTDMYWFPVILSVIGYSVFISSHIGFGPDFYLFCIITIPLVIADIEDSLSSYVSEFTPHLFLCSVILFVYHIDNFSIALSLVLFLMFLQLLRGHEALRLFFKNLPESDAIGFVSFIAILATGPINMLESLAFLVLSFLFLACLKVSHIRLFSMISPATILLMQSY